MKLTASLITKLEQSMWVNLTPEQRVIMRYWYGHEPKYGWDEEDFVDGIRKVMRLYPDHRPKQKHLPDLLMKEAEYDLF